jgi:hypothetical protein
MWILWRILAEFLFELRDYCMDDFMVVCGYAARIHKIVSLSPYSRYSGWGGRRRKRNKDEEDERNELKFVTARG